MDETQNHHLKCGDHHHGGDDHNDSDNYNQRIDMNLIENGDQSQEHTFDDELVTKTTPLINGTTISIGKGRPDKIGRQETTDSNDHKIVELIWNDLTYKLNTNHWKAQKKFPFLQWKRQTRTILEKQNGNLRTGMLTAIIGEIQREH